MLVVPRFSLLRVKAILLVISAVMALGPTTMAWADVAGVIDAQILSLSDSQKTVLLNIGKRERVRSGDWLVLIKDTQDKDGLRYRLVARGRVLRSSPKRAMVMLYKVHAKDLLARGTYQVLAESCTMNGRRDLQNDRLKLIDGAATMPATVADKREGDLDTLAIRKDAYGKIQKNHEDGWQPTRDGVLIDGDAWVEKDERGKVRYAEALWRSPLEADFARGARMETFDKMVATHLMRINDPFYSYEKFYNFQKASLEGGPSGTVYEEFMEAESKRRDREVLMRRQLLSKGDGWSSDYSDEELGRMLESVGSLHEADRRASAQVLARSWLLGGSLGLNLLDNENRTDSANARKAKWNMEAQAEWFPAPRHETVRRLGLWFGGRYVEDGVSIGARNARYTESGLALGFNWHPWQFPTVVGQSIVFVGAGVRNGRASLELATGERGSYGVFAIPMLVGGVKHNFRSGWGLRLALSVEKLQLEQTATNSVGGELPGRTDLQDGRLSLGLTRFL